MFLRGELAMALFSTNLAPYPMPVDIAKGVPNAGSITLGGLAPGFDLKNKALLW